ncbi:MAG: fibronectin type III domain-containing protein [archaeon]
MKKIFLFFCMSILLISLTSAFSICIDHTPPSAPSNLAISGEVGNILLTWTAATDEPDCSGIEEYIISRGGVEIGRRDDLRFIDLDVNLGAGGYNYTVYAVDKAGHNTGSAVINSVTIENGESNNVVSSGGGGGSSYICVEEWVCGNWSDCVGNDQRRLCEDLNKCGPENDKPITYLECGIEDDSEYDMTLITNTKSDEGSDEGFLSSITGAVTGAVGTAGGIGIIVFMVLVSGGFVAIRIRKMRR